jgi:hypothetical protein
VANFPRNAVHLGLRFRGDDTLLLRRSTCLGAYALVTLKVRGAGSFLSAFSVSSRAHFSQAKFAFALGLLCTVFAAPVGAQSLEDRLRDQLRSTLNELHQEQDQQAALQAAKTAAEQERDALKAQLAAAKAQLTHLAHAGQSAASSRALEVEVAKYKDAYTQAAGNAQQAQADHDKLQSGLGDAQKQLGVCEDKNAALLKLGNEILSAYESFDVGDAVGANEPFIGIKRVELENIAQGFGDHLNDGKFDPRATHASPSAGGGN